MAGIGASGEVIAIVSGLTGAGIGAVARAMTGNRRVDKVDAVAAISEAYKSVIHRLESQLDSLDKNMSAQIEGLNRHVEELRAEIVRKDAMLERMVERLSTAPAVVPVPIERHIRASDEQSV